MYHSISTSLLLMFEVELQAGQYFFSPKPILTYCTGGKDPLSPGVEGKIFCPIFNRRVPAPEQLSLEPPPRPLKNPPPDFSQLLLKEIPPSPPFSTPPPIHVPERVFESILLLFCFGNHRPCQGLRRFFRPDVLSQFYLWFTR